MLDEGELRRRFPEIAWDQPVLIQIAGLKWVSCWACRYCIAMHGLKAQDIIQRRVPEMVYHSRKDALAHIAAVHHD